jgi:acetoacetyl-CoA synthetase
MTDTALHAGDLVWSPTPDRVATSTLRVFLNWLEEREGRSFVGHAEFWAWSVEHLDRFWRAMWDYVGMAGAPGTVVHTTDPMPATRWFPGARLNYAEHCLRPGADGDLALICLSEADDTERRITRGELRRDVAALAAWLRGVGVQPGDRVVGYLPNTEHAMIACLAAASVGAVWAVCSPDFGADGTVARLAQLEPTVLFTVDGYHWNGRRIDRRDVATRLADELPSLREVVHVPYAFPEADPGAGRQLWCDVLAVPGEPFFEQVEFSHPLWVLFSSGTTGAPKGLVHGHGGITLEHLTWNTLYAGMRPGERMFVYTSTTWMLWNLLLSALASGATPVLYEGSPAQPDAGVVWDIAARTNATLVLLGAALVTGVQNSGISPRERFDLTGLRTLMVSGSALPTEGYFFVRDHIGAHVRLDSTSGGTDICGPFVGGNELSPVYAGEIPGPLAGVAVAAWNDAGDPVVGEVGELVITRPMPSMPVGLWNDPDGTRSRETYFDTWPGIWRHGDWITLTERGTFIVHGRSDATLNRDGVRLGSADFYDVVDTIPGVAESLVVGVDEPVGGYYLPLFVVPTPGTEVDDALRELIRKELRTRRSPRHVPDEIVAAPAVPHTLTGKRLEVPVKKLLAGVPLERAVNLAAVDDPEVVHWYARFAQARRADDAP